MIELNCVSQVYRVVGPDAYFMGIIDFQQKWTIAKRVSVGCCSCCCCLFIVDVAVIIIVVVVLAVVVVVL